MWKSPQNWATPGGASQCLSRYFPWLLEAGLSQYQVLLGNPASQTDCLRDSKNRARRSSARKQANSSCISTHREAWGICKVSSGGPQESKTQGILSRRLRTDTFFFPRGVTCVIQMCLPGIFSRCYILISDYPRMQDFYLPILISIFHLQMKMTSSSQFLLEAHKLLTLD